ncbi:MAG: ATP-binding protein [Chloroflexota bacterium]
MNRLWLMISLPHFEDDPEKTRHAQLLHVVSLALLIVFIVSIIVNLALDTQFGKAINAILIASALLQVVILVLIKRGYVRAAGYILLILSWISITWIASRFDGVRSVTLFAYFTIILSAGYIYGWRTVTLFTSWSILGVWVLAFYEDWGISKPVMDTPISIAINLTGLFIFSSVQIYFIINFLKKSLRDADQELRERLRIEQVLRSEQERLALALDASKMGTWNWDIETGTISWSDQIEALFGIGKGEFDGKYDTYLSLIHPEDLPNVQQEIGRALVTPEYHYVIEHRLIWHNGETRWVEGRGNVYPNAAGRPNRMAGTVVDVTERKRGEAERERLIHELAAKNTELEQFTYTVSHDLKAPIITIKGFLGFLEQDAAAGNQARLQRDVERINGAVEKMQDLLNDLLELSRIGRMLNSPEPIAFGTLVNEAIELLQGRLQASVPQIKVDQNFPAVQGDRRRLLEVVQNLIDNAVKFSSKQTEPVIEIGTRGLDNGMPVFFVRDNGIGIAPEHHERIFGLFNKLDPLAEGTGIGLAIVKRIIEFHGGRIWVESAVSKGATFYFALPQ